MNVSTAAVRFDDGAVRIELSDGAAAIPEQGSLVLPAEAARSASGPRPPKSAVWIFSF